jgi:two-component system sensor histidine kinase/response regulator
MDLERKPRVLVVDDIESNIEFVSEVLAMEDIEIISAKTGADALGLAFKNIPDLILLDISMPLMNGFEVSKLLKNDDLTKDIPIIFLTARVEKEDIINGFEHGAVDYITKPFNFSELISRVKTHLELKHKTELLKNLNVKLELDVNNQTHALKKAYEDIRIVNLELQEAHDKLSKLDKVKTEFVHHINHELRTPLNGIQGYVDLLKESCCDESSSSYIKSIESLTERLIRVAELSLLFTELKTRKHEVVLQPVNFVEVLNETIGCFNTTQKNINIRLENPFNELIIQAEHKLLFTCLSIVIENALKYSPSNSFISISIGKNDKNIEFILLDNGAGFSEKALEQLFNFFSADNLHHHTNGFGIGLATAKLILDVISGEIFISNRIPNGSMVKIVLPYQS